MLYLDDEYLNYKYVVSYSDNYLVLSETRSVYADYQEPEDLQVLVKYIDPSDIQFETIQTFYTDRVFPEIDVTSSDWERADISKVLFCASLIVVLTLFIYNILSKIFVRGGMCR